MVSLADFDYYLPKELIAQYPLKERDKARLLVVDRSKGTLAHRTFRDTLEYLNKSDLIVFNDTKVLPSRLIGRRSSGGKVEALLLVHKDSLRFEALLKPARLKIGERVAFGKGDLWAKVTGRNEIVFEADSPESVYSAGVMPLPPYIKRDTEGQDSEYYQTVYAKNSGAVAAPTAGLHFTREFIGDIESRGVNTAYITLHVGSGTFKPVKAEDITRHKMDPESFCVSLEAELALKKSGSCNSRVFAVGTTSLRALEAYGEGRSQGHTDLFIYPGYEFKVVDCLLTNFHLPRSTLFMLVCAFCGQSLAKEAYREAISRNYRFYSYGDAMLII